MYDKEWIKPYLSAGELILWTGRPENRSVFTKRDLSMIPFSIVWCGFAIFWEVSAITSGAPLLFQLWGIPFVFAGLYFVFGRFFVEKARLKNTQYAVTSKKVLFCCNKKVSLLDRATLPAMSMEGGKNGAGTIFFGVTPQHIVCRRVPYQSPSHQLTNIAQVSRVWDILAQPPQ